MHDIKFIKNNPKVFDDSLLKRNLNPCSDQIISLHDEYLGYLNKKQNLQEKKNFLSKQFSQEKVDINETKAQVLDIKKELESLNQVAEKKNKRIK